MYIYIYFLYGGTPLGDNFSHDDILSGNIFFFHDKIDLEYNFPHDNTLLGGISSHDEIDL